MTWRNDLNGEFPSACGDWAEKCGCTRVELAAASCTRPGDIKKDNTIVFVVGEDNDRMLNNRIASCAANHHSSKLMSPKGLADSTEAG